MIRDSRRPQHWIAAVTLIMSVLSAASWLNPVKPGLRAEYFRNTQWRGTPAVSQRDRGPSTGAVLNTWGDELPDTFSVSWSGYLLVLRGGRYTFETVSDDGSWLDVDGRRVIDNGGVHGAAPVAAVVVLDRGIHAVHLEYVQNGGRMALEWFAARDDAPLTAISSWMLTPRRTSFAAFVASAALQLATTAAMWAWFAVLGCAGTVWAWRRGTPLQAQLREQGVWPALPVVIGGAMLLNAVPLWWGLPGGFWPPDELTPKDVAVAAGLNFAHGWGERYPPFHYYVLFAGEFPVSLLEWLGLVDPGSLAGETMRAVLGRLMTLAASGATLVLLFACARRLFNTRAALMAVAECALVTPFVYYSKTANLDVPYLFWFALAFWFLVRLVEGAAKAPHYAEAEWANIIGYAVAATLAIGTKDQAYGLFALPSLLIVYALWLRHRRAEHPHAALRAITDWRLLTGVLTAVAVFALAHNLLFNSGGFRRHLALILGGASQDYRMFPATVAGEAGLLALTWHIVQTALGWPLLVLFASGAVTAWVAASTRRSALVVSLPAVSYYVTFIAVVGYSYDRFLLPVFFLGAIFGGYALDRWLDLAIPAAARAGLASIALAYSLAYAASVDILMLHDSRYTLERYLSTHAQSADRIGFVFPSLYNPRLDAWSNGEMTSIEQLQWEKPRWFVLNEDYGRLEPADTPIGQLVHGLEAGALEYAPVYHARTPRPFAWLPFPHRDLTGPRLEPLNEITSSLRHINPQFVVFERQ